MTEVTLIIPFYRNVGMLEMQMRNWSKYDPQTLSRFRFVVVDDGSPEFAEPVVRQNATAEVLERTRLYRIGIDIPWNRGGARNLGTASAGTDWIVHTDIDHVLYPKHAARLAEFEPNPETWYRFARWRVGRADETRRKDKIPPDDRYGRIHSHVDSYLCTRARYWKAGGYDEDYSGCIGGGNPFLAKMTAIGQPEMAPDDVALHVYTRDMVKDASDWSLSRDPAEYTRRKRAKEAKGDTVPHNPLRFPWTRIL